MKKKVLITGGTGNIGSTLTDFLEKQQYEVLILTRKKSKENHLVYWDLDKKEIEAEKLKDVNIIINLVGAGIADENWSDARKKVIIESRTETTKFLFNVFKNEGIQLETYIGASASGYYGGVTKNKVFKESDNSGDDFLAEVCVKWEASHDLFKTIAKNHYIVRIGVVLTKTGGALEKMAAPVKLYAGAALGSGKQIVPWIHVQDLIGIFHHLMDNQLERGIYNGVSPNPINNKTLTKYIGKALGKPIILPNVPAFVLRLALGEMSVIVLEGSEISSEKITDAAYQFKYSMVDDALNNLLY